MRVMKQSHILIIGGGFAGMNAAKKLAKNKQVKVTLVDRRNHHLFQPLLYQVATAGLSPAEIATPIRSIFADNENVTVLMNEAIAFHLSKNQVQFTDHHLSYDYLIMACGANHSYFGHGEWESYAPGLKTIEQATEIRRRILTAFEQAEIEDDPQLKEAWMTFAVVGAGPTGVELAGAISELSQHTILKEFRNIDPAMAKILLIEAGPRVLAQFDEKLGVRAKNDLEELGTDVRLNTRVLEVNEQGLKTEKEFIASRTVIWAAGVAPSVTGRELSESDSQVKLDPSGRVMVNDDLSVPGFKNVFVLGDQAHFKGKEGRPLPGLAPVAMQQGRHAALNVLNLIQGKATISFRYLDKGQMATIGRKRAVVQAGKIKFGGFIAWLAWLLIHVYYIIGFKNRLFILMQWTWSYVTFSRSARLIVDKDWRLKS